MCDFLDRHYDLMSDDTMRLCVTHDAPMCLVGHLRNGLFPTPEDSVLLYSKPERVIRLWKQHSLAMTNSVRMWLDSL
jgi:hypothetical protein